MKVTVLKKDKRFEVRNDKSLGIQCYGENNDYPQQVDEVIDASATGKPCVETYAKFINGRGFFDRDFYKMVVNKKGQTNDYLLHYLSQDLAKRGGVAIHVNYNANFKKTQLQFFPLETLRFEKLDDNGNFNRIAYHPDWGRRFTSLRKWKKEDIEFFDLYNPDPEIIKEQVERAGGWHNYKGQVFYYSNQGEKEYPVPIFDNVLTDMNTEEGISNVSNRNARNNFLTAGMLIDYKSGDESKEQEDETEKALKTFQGDETACKMLYIQVDNPDQKPEFVSFRGTNYDKEFTVTETSVKDKIGRAFTQPPILRAEDVGANFGADLMRNAYDFYNSVIENERLALERIFTELFKEWHIPINPSFEIEPLSYVVKMTLFERLGEKGFDTLMRIVENEMMPAEQKRSMLKRTFDLEDEELNDLMPV